jgi:hypothetical protein
MDSGRDSALKLFQGLLTSWEVLHLPEPHLSLYSRKIEFGSPLGGLNLTFFTLSVEGSTVVFIGGVRWCSGQRFVMGGPLVRPAGHVSCLGGQGSSLHRLWALHTLSTASAGHVDKTFCATSFSRVIFSMTMPHFGHNEDMNGFWSIWCFSIIRCS